MRGIFITVLFSFLLGNLVSCTIDTSQNGDLDGAWHLLSVNDTVCFNRQIYWNIQGDLLETMDKERLSYRFVLRFKHEGGLLTLSNPHIHDRVAGDPLLEDTSKLEHVGIKNIDEPFAVVKLNGSRMTLQATNNKLDFRKF